MRCLQCRRVEHDGQTEPIVFGGRHTDMAILQGHAVVPLVGCAGGMGQAVSVSDPSRADIMCGFGTVAARLHRWRTGDDHALNSFAHTVRNHRPCEKRCREVGPLPRTRRVGHGVPLFLPKLSSVASRLSSNRRLAKCDPAPGTPSPSGSPSTVVLDYGDVCHPARTGR